MVGGNATYLELIAVGAVADIAVLVPSSLHGFRIDAQQRPLIYEHAYVMRSANLGKSSQVSEFKLFFAHQIQLQRSVCLPQDTLTGTERFQAACYTHIVLKVDYRSLRCEHMWPGVMGEDCCKTAVRPLTKTPEDRLII